MKIYKFRAISDEGTLKRAADIVLREQLWFSSLWEQNDSLEGVYLSDSVDDHLIFNGKDQFKICSFSARNALEEPMMWAHYANGFKGIAVEIKVDPGEEFHDVTYSDEPVRRGAASDGASDITAAVREIITRKTTRWEYESEIRCLKKRAEAGGEFVGKISGVYFGSPYGGVSNRTQVIGASEVLREYYQLRHCLEVAAVSRGLECFEAYLSHGHKGAEVRIAELPRSKCPTNPSGDPNLTDEVQ